MRATPLSALVDFGVSTSSMAGALGPRLAALREAGFSNVLVDAADLVDHVDGVDAAVALVVASGLRVIGLQALEDFEGESGARREHRTLVARTLLDLCRAVGSPLLVVLSSTSPHSSGDVDGLARDLRRLAMLGIPLGVRIGYQALSWGRHVADLDAAWEVVGRADVPSLGLVVDAFHAMTSDASLEAMQWLDPTRVFLVKLADSLSAATDSVDERKAIARHAQVFPGEGVDDERLRECLLRLGDLGYAGDIAFDVHHDDHRQMPQRVVAERARRAAVWLSEEVLRRSAPLPRSRGTVR